MSDRRASLALTAAAMLAAACGPQRVAPAPVEPSGYAQVVLLPDPDGGTVGRVTVSTPAGSVDLVAPRDSTRIVVNRPPSPVTPISEADVTRIFGDALSALPPPPRHFVLYFRFESDELTDQSRALLPEILESVKNRPAPDVVVIGHTDTTGTSERNYQLGLKRAHMIRNLLVANGLDPSFVDEASHGEANLLVPTKDETFESRNRRVEITVR
jgi:outer membrane protein OmpA-like peptidoglycan-associated protein